jgi:hypothetical protein
VASRPRHTSGSGSRPLAAGILSALCVLSLLAWVTAPARAINYPPAPPISISIVSPADGAFYTQGEAVAIVYSCAAFGGAALTACAGPVANGVPLDTKSPGSHIFRVEAKDATGATASKSVSYTVAAVAPNTVLGSHPKKTIDTTRKKAKVRFGFSSSAAGATFKCQLDKGSLSSCASPKSYEVKPGSHRFSVEAVTAGGADPSPATFNFKVKRQKSH